LPALLACHVAVGDEIRFPVAASGQLETEIYVKNNSSSSGRGDLYLAQIGHVAQAKKDKRGRLSVCAEVRHGVFGLATVVLPCEVLREYFFGILSDRKSLAQPTFYDLLRMPPTASPAELQVGFKLRELELREKNSIRAERVAVERAFNTRRP
jgi:hypothetical protein